MDILGGFDPSHLAGSSGVAVAILYVATRVIKPLLDKFLKSLPASIDANTEAVKELIASEQRASGYNREEHAQITAHLKVLTDTLLKINGRPPVKSDDKGFSLEEPSLSLDESESSSSVSKAEFAKLQADVSKIASFLKGE